MKIFSKVLVLQHPYILACVLFNKHTYTHIHTLTATHDYELEAIFLKHTNRGLQKLKLFFECNFHISCVVASFPASVPGFHLLWCSGDPVFISVSLVSLVIPCGVALVLPIFGGCMLSVKTSLCRDQSVFPFRQK